MSKYKLGQKLYSVQMVHEFDTIMVIEHEIILAKKTYRTKPELGYAIVLHDHHLDELSATPEDAVKKLKRVALKAVLKAQDLVDSAKAELKLVGAAVTKVITLEDHDRKLQECKRLREEIPHNKDIL
jgi:hypothetical protein